MKQPESKIETCASTGCDWKCCHFDAGNYIIMQPDELARARRNGVSTDHLKTIESDYHGGQKVVCTAKNTASCDGGLKPNDCQYYPLYPAVDGAGKVTQFIRGAKCPLVNGSLSEHTKKVAKDVQEQIAKQPELAKFFAKVEMVGYEPPRPFPASNQNAKPCCMAELAS